ncbi:hypothetical protein U9M48_005310 [Paspalum notatum var. saurae]|uniref:Uncharacterized protein n=1 Tax=Paspalum notatum var. saurae TaxID=547442 RepID=A0AAQ3SLC9_PASNO
MANPGAASRPWALSPAPSRLAPSAVTPPPAPPRLASPPHHPLRLTVAQPQPFPAPVAAVRSPTPGEWRAGMVRPVIEARQRWWTEAAWPSSRPRRLSLHPSPPHGRPAGERRAGMVRPAAEDGAGGGQRRYAGPATTHCGGGALAPLPGAAAPQGRRGRGPMLHMPPPRSDLALPPRDRLGATVPRTHRWKLLLLSNVPLLLVNSFYSHEDTLKLTPTSPDTGVMLWKPR